MVDTSIDAPEGGGAAIPIKLHVAGPRGSDDPTAYSSTRALIAELLASQPAAGAKKDADSKPPVVAIESLLSAKQGRGAHPGQDLVCGVLVSETRTELLMLRSQAMDNMWRFPGGQAGDDETLVSALARESMRTWVEHRKVSESIRMEVPRTKSPGRSPRKGLIIGPQWAKPASPGHD